MSNFEAATTDFLDTKYIPLEKKYKLIIAAVILIVALVIFFFTFFKRGADADRAVNTSQSKGSCMEPFDQNAVGYAFKFK